MEIEPAKDLNVEKIKECIKELKLEVNPEHITTRMHKLIEQLPRLIVQDNVLYRKFFGHNGDYHLQTVIPEHLEQELLCRLNDQMQHAGIQKCVADFRKRFYFPDIYEKLRRHIRNCATCIQTKPARLKKSECQWNQYLLKPTNPAK